MRITTIIGARPQFIKAAAVSAAIRERAATVEETVVHTGQHYDPAMSAIFFDELGMPTPAHNLGIGSGRHGDQTGQMLRAIERVLLTARPDCVLVYGDTNSTLAGALAASKLRIPVAHVEAGLRSGNRAMPEEINRVVTDHLASLLFAPTAAASVHLRREGIPDDQVHTVGDVMYDTAVRTAARAEASSQVLSRVGLIPRAYALCTVHRAENTDDHRRLQAIFCALGRLSARLPVVCPLHPRTRRALQDAGLLERTASQVTLIEPAGYLDMTMLQKNAALIATDSGGVQKEAFFHRVPCVTLRDETEWVELVELGWNRLAPPGEPDSMYAAMWNAVGTRGREATPYGDGHAARRIVEVLTGQAC